ncbi:60 kDa SS-A/Ro ribonucleoprotein isoform X1 [Oreochromis aureus]|uniref:TROVE domain-containing protein n=1 Tax=Oreochromis aureus TaxID=47969 RepID=A0AAZ1XAR4_OREAU|nr:60 kDa SS-A/Ro ribonucleoprotein isoform X1 [Oreochromis aureus]XP_031610704.1 60 kDa SS-A/Ro ribonucleoprotein isoform X1 [Oreochromis aureus]
MELSGSTTSNHTLNSTGVGSWEISDKAKLCRFLCYGSERDLYSTKENGRIKLENTGALQSMLEEKRGAEVLEEIKRFAQDGRAVRLEPSIFALALCSQNPDVNTKQAAFKALKDVCREPAHLFSFIKYKKELKEHMKCGIWGRALRRALSDWYNEQDAMSLAAAVTKCKQREGWSHQDLLRLSHTKPARDAIALISKYVTKGWKEVQVAHENKENAEEVIRVLSYLEVVEKVKHSRDETEVVTLIEEHKLEREQLLTEHLKFKQVWSALLKEMPLHSVVKMLGRLTSGKVLEPGSSETQFLCDRIQSETALKQAKIHPFSILLATENYKKGHGYQGKPKWEADRNILKAMDSAFYKSFMNVEPVGKCFVVAVDMSGSPSSIVPGTSISTAAAAAAIAMILARTEADTHVLVYSQEAMVPFSISADMTLKEATDELVKSTRERGAQPSGSAFMLQFLSESRGCTVPIQWATENRKAVDVFVILSTNPLLMLTASPVESLKKHRETSGANSKLVMCDLTNTGFPIGDTEDRGLLTISGFDLGAFSVIRNLAQDLI